MDNGGNDKLGLIDRWVRLILERLESLFKQVKRCKAFLSISIEAMSQNTYKRHEYLNASLSELNKKFIDIIVEWEATDILMFSEADFKAWLTPISRIQGALHVLQLQAGNHMQVFNAQKSIHDIKTFIHLQEAYGHEGQYNGSKRQIAELEKKINSFDLADVQAFSAKFRHDCIQEIEHEIKMLKMTIGYFDHNDDNVSRSLCRGETVTSLACFHYTSKLGQNVPNRVQVDHLKRDVDATTIRTIEALSETLAKKAEFIRHAANDDLHDESDEITIEFLQAIDSGIADSVNTLPADFQRNELSNYLTSDDARFTLRAIKLLPDSLTLKACATQAAQSIPRLQM